MLPGTNFWAHTEPYSLFTLEAPTKTFEEIMELRTMAWIEDAILFSSIQREIASGKHWEEFSFFSRMFHANHKVGSPATMHAPLDTTEEEDYFNAFFCFY